MENFRSISKTLAPTWCLVLVPLCWAVLHAEAGQKNRDISLMFAQLNDPNTSNEAAQEIIQVADKDPAARKYVSDRLPDIIDKLPESLVWRNSVKLAGHLKSANAVPALTRVLPRAESDVGIQSFALAWGLGRDPVGMALCEIGDPAVPAMAELLNRGDMSAKWRALRVLWNIDSPASRKALDDYLHNGDDPKIQSAIETLRKTKPHSVEGSLH